MDKTYHSLIDIDTGGASKSIKELKDEVKKLNTQLEGLDENTEEYANTAKRAQAATTQLDSVMGNIRERGEMVGETMGHVTRMAGGLAGGFELIQGVMALTGKEGGNFEKVMQKVAASMAIANSVSALGDSFESLTKVFPAAGVALENFGNKLKNVLKLLKGWPGILLAVGTAITTFFIKMKRDALNAELALTESISKVKISLAEETGAVKEMKAVWDSLDLEGRKKYYSENREEIDKMTGSQNDFNAAEKFFIEHTDDYIDALILRARAEAKREEIIKGYIEEEEIRAEIAKKKKILEVSGDRQRFETNAAAAGGWNVFGEGQMIDPIEKEIQDLETQLNLILDLRNDIRQKAIELEQEAARKLSFQDEDGGAGSGLDDATKALIAKRKEYKALQLQLEAFASTVTKLNNIPVSQMIDSVLAPQSTDLTNMTERNKLVAELNTLLTDTQAKVDGLNIFNKNKDDRKKASKDLSRLLKGESDETDALKADQKGLLDERDIKTSEYEQGIIDKEAYAEAIMEIDEKIYKNAADLEAKMVENRKEGLMTVEELAYLSADLVSGLMGALANNFEEGSAAYKAFKISETIISTLSGSIKAYDSLAGLPVVGPALGAIAAATVLANGVATVNQIRSVQPGKTESVNTSALNMAAASPTVQSHVMNDAINVNQEKNTKVYVTEHDLRETSNKVKVAESESRF